MSNQLDTPLDISPTTDKHNPAGRGANRCAVDDQFQSKPFPVGPAANEECQERPLNGEL